MYKKLAWFLLGAIAAEILKIVILSYILVEAVLQFIAKTTTHPWSYYIILLAISFSLNKIKLLFNKGVNDERKAHAESEN